MTDKWDELRELHQEGTRPGQCLWCHEDWPCAVLELLDENEKLQAALDTIADHWRAGASCRWARETAQKALGDAP